MRKRDKKKKFISNFDPLGSYTGTPTGTNETPTQDADDLWDKTYYSLSKISLKE